MNNKIKNIQDELNRLSNSEIAEHSQRFFKTGKGEYGEGDKFLGIRVPLLRQLTKKYKGPPIIQLNIRRRLVLRFPYSLLYRVDTEEAVVLAVAHQQRHPAYWIGRVL